MSKVSKIIQKKAKVISNIHLTGNYYRLALNLPEVTRVAWPGQFVMLRINQGYKPLLRRPFSIHRANSQLEILYEVVGRGTELMTQKKPGQYLDVLGPLGNGFSILDSQFSILVGGGIGIAPLLFFAEKLTGRKTQNARRETLVLIGANTKKEILSQKEFANLGLDVKISTDDGSAGFKGKVTDLLRNILRKTQDARHARIYACGPKPMLKEISTISKRYNIPAQISYDEYMACGLGVCLGCMIETEAGYQRVCKEGPVFDSAVII